MGREDTVGDLVAALVETYAAGTEHYAAWRRRTWERDDYRYHRRDIKGNAPATPTVVDDENLSSAAAAAPNTKTAENTAAQISGAAAAVAEEKERDDAKDDGDGRPLSGGGGRRGHIGGFCAASISLRISEARIREAFENGVDMLGEEFAVGDETCCGILRDNLDRLSECIHSLEIATTPAAAQADNGRNVPLPLPLGDVIRVSESVRGSSLTALHRHYQKVAVGRLMPRQQQQQQRHANSGYDPKTLEEESEGEKIDDEAATGVPDSLDPDVKDLTGTTTKPVETRRRHSKKKRRKEEKTPS